ncbi:hypothetical protein C8N32_10519 [Rhodovulum imhoffii]|uniref:Uncharacterized protein n=1 Tax=Rhodovulum imhoffii TaxID=365340 RepID=A0A2T5BTG4_9RHOB|nr:hypothetical protein [Rhodovulum imhoffii]PTN02649.1 hypothetical protein C8N32_10519 [Rhodovulum imhoffii]
MDIIGPLMLGTIGTVLALAYINLRQTEEKLRKTREARRARVRALPAE